jgi:hypothetical protein
MKSNMLWMSQATATIGAVDGLGRRAPEKGPLVTAAGDFATESTPSIHPRIFWAPASILASLDRQADALKRRAAVRPRTRVSDCEPALGA